MKHLVKFFLFVFTVGLIYGCDKELEELEQTEYHIAVFLPLTGNLKNEWAKSSEWILDNINKYGGVANGKVVIDWYDTQNEDIESLASRIATDTSIIAAIGPFSSSKAFKAAPYFVKNKKAMFTMASSEEITRAFSGKDYIWRLIESDIAQCKNLLLVAKNKRVKSVALLTSDDAYGTSFFNWFGFFAQELGIEVTRVERFQANQDNVYNNMVTVLDTKPELIACVPSTMEQAFSMIDAWKKTNHPCKILFSDIVYMPELLKNEQSAEGIEGLVMIPEPSSGFDIEYKVRYGHEPLLGIAQLYDAIMVIALGIEASKGKSGDELVKGIKRVVDGREGKVFWDEYDIQDAIRLIQKGIYPDIKGASSTLNYDPKSYLDVTSSTYAHWQVNMNKFHLIDYYSNNFEGRASNTSSAWYTFASNIDNLSMGVDYDLPPKKELKVLLVASSKGWSNYRHQADLLALYQLLKQNGLSDEDIILITEDDIATHQRNTERGKIKTSEGGDNVYINVANDYLLADINKIDIFNILQGVKTERTPIVIEATNQTDILFYFIDHGIPEGLLVEGERDELISAEEFYTHIKSFTEKATYRKLLICIEACYSGSIGELLNFQAPVMCITASNNSESSMAINYSNTLNTWLSNNFSNQFVNELVLNPNITISDLYVNLNKKVNGSHVCIFNEENFENISTINISEFTNP